ncbi:MAG: methyltransferase domain-containing protein [Acidobacteriota bacterium]
MSTTADPQHEDVEKNHPNAESDAEYLLGHGQQEWQRLADQHRVWRHTLLDSLERLPLADDADVLEVGCGSGALLADLVHLTAGGRTVGVEIDPEAVERARRALGDKATVHQGDVFELELDDRFDLIVCRWVLSFLHQPKRAVERMAAHLKPGGVLVIQDYNYDGLRVTPGDPALDRLFEVVPEAYAQNGGDAWVATHLPRLFAELALELEAVEPHCLAGDHESPVFGWVETFFRNHIPTLVKDGLLSDDEAARALEAWTAVHDVPGTVLFSPLVVNVIGRKPIESLTGPTS